ncbi:MAG: hypothetical protein LBE47_02705 [Methanomassiliicoccaceae archaeon]|jgi:hypothetical protein|nr:hypothetical protein [Methanomassiliicoccaceae archaeon]
MKDVELDMHRSIDELGKFSVTLKIDTERDIFPNDMCSILERMMIDITKACFDNGANMIGHVKACAHNADDGNNICTANLTSFRTGVRTNDMMNGMPFNSGYIMMHVIVHGLWDPQVREISLKAIDGLIPSYGLEYRVMRDFFETEKRVKG